jgi:hypothetical protein
VRFKLAILNVLAKYPDRYLTLDEVRREVGTLDGAQTEQLKRFSALGDIDIFQSGLVLQDNAGLQITDAGLALLHSLQGSGEVLAPSPSSRIADNLADLDEGFRVSDQVLSAPSVAPKAPYAASHLSAVNPGKRQDFKVRKGRRRLFDFDRLFDFLRSKKQSILDIGSRHYAQNRSAVSGKNERSPRGREGAAFALLSLLLVIACVVTAIAFGQIQSLKSDIAALRRELLPVKDRVAKLEQSEKAKRDAEQEEETQSKSEIDKNKTGNDARTNQTGLNLSREEIQLIRDYIKPAPSSGPAAPPITVGDAVSGAMIPLPSQLTEKVPKLLGGKFTIRNGAIIIVKRDSRQVDAVLAPN